MHPDRNLSLFHYRNHGPQWVGYNVNGLTDDENFNEITGNAGFGDMMVAIDRVDLAL